MIKFTGLNYLKYFSCKTQAWHDLNNLETYTIAFTVLY